MWRDRKPGAAIWWAVVAFFVGLWVGVKVEGFSGTTAIESCDTEVMQLQVELNEAREAFFREKAAWESEHD